MAMSPQARVEIGGPGRTGKLTASAVDLERIKYLRIGSIIIIGFLASVLSGLLGIGGGSIMVPTMVYLLGMNQHRAHGTSLAVIAVVVMSSAVYYSRHGLVDWTIAIELMAGGVIGAMIGARICALLHAARLRRYFGVLLAFVGFRMLYGAVLLSFGAPHIGGDVLAPQTLGGGAAMVAIGFVTGVISGLFGIGGGLIMVPTLVLLFGFLQKLAQGISLAVMIPVSISGALIHHAHGNVNWGVAFWLVLGGILGGLVGAHLAVLKIDEPVLRGMFGLLMFVVGLLMFRHRRPARD